MPSLLAFLSIRRILQLGAAAILIGAVAYGWHAYAERGREITRLEAEIAAYQEAARALDARARLLSEKLAATEAARARKTETLREEIRRAPASDDAPVAPVLRRALDGLRQR
jgi:hypothetical protein